MHSIGLIYYIIIYNYNIIYIYIYIVCGHVMSSYIQISSGYSEPCNLYCYVIIRMLLLLGIQVVFGKREQASS